MILHACKDDIEHLRERGLGCGLVDEVLAGQVDVVAGAHGLQDGALVDFYVLGGHGCQQSLAEKARGEGETDDFLKKDDVSSTRDQRCVSKAILSHWSTWWKS